MPATLPPDMTPPSKRKRGAGLAGAVAVMPGTTVQLYINLSLRVVRIIS